MIRGNRAIAIALPFILVFASQTRVSGSLQTLQFPATANKDSIVRFFYHPNPGSYFHIALIFRVVSETDPKWNTAPVHDVGRTAYITRLEMEGILIRLSDSQLSWTVSNVVEPLETYKTIHSFGGMSVKVLSSTTTAKASIRPEAICTTLAPLDQALHTPRGLWEFQRFRIQFHCKAPNFNPKTYPD
jgi:hypothetical protein